MHLCYGFTFFWWVLIDHILDSSDSGSLQYGVIPSGDDQNLEHQVNSLFLTSSPFGRFPYLVGGFFLI